MRKARKMVLNRNHTHTSKLGASLRFKKGEPTLVAPAIQPEILAIGGEFVEGEQLEVEQQNEEVALHPAEREAKLLEAVITLAERNDNDDFTAAGQPKVDSVIKQTGFKATAKEIAAAWQKRADMIAEGEIDG